ncbi:GNAT family N-acetyltransferase [Nostoc foliaceum FACHB-393]|uniref:GNAT family N-acetyltransferase n=1 Tax=Nostoc foliaceum FACHB-393 TaxID=2692915 RepID=A0ABR8IJ47_9NOSO|nr:GNAT family N-acetyltransferase [Nostoc foliaceum FACHB-393]
MFETPRLLVRQLLHSDADALFRICSDPVVMRWIGNGTPFTHEKCVESIEICLSNYQIKGFGASAVVAKDTGELVGCCGILYEPDRGEPEIIYGFGQRWWKQGYASEIVPAMLAYGLNRCGLRRVLANIEPENLASQRVAQKAGMVFEGEKLNTGGFSICVYSFESNIPASLTV